MTEEVRIATDASARLVVDALHGRLQLFAGGLPWLSTTGPGSWRIATDREYHPVYDNNAGGRGTLSMWIAETDGEADLKATDYAVFYDRIDGAQVLELPPFVVVADA